MLLIPGELAIIVVMVSRATCKNEFCPRDKRKVRCPGGHKALQSHRGTPSEPAQIHTHTP